MNKVIEAMARDIFDADWGHSGGNWDAPGLDDNARDGYRKRAIRYWTAGCEALTVDNIDSVLDDSQCGPMRFDRKLFREALIDAANE